MVEEIESTSTVFGSSPKNPTMMALSVPCPLPVSANDPWREQWIWATGFPSKARAKAAAARMGPTVCEDDGPIPIENMSTMERYLWEVILVVVQRFAGNYFKYFTSSGAAVLSSLIIKSAMALAPFLLK